MSIGPDHLDGIPRPPSSPIDPQWLRPEPLTEGFFAAPEQELVQAGYEIVGVYQGVNTDREVLDRYSTDLKALTDADIEWTSTKRGSFISVLWKRVRPAPAEELPEVPGYRFEQAFVPEFSLAADLDESEPLIPALMRRESELARAKTRYKVVWQGEKGRRKAYLFIEGTEEEE